MNNPFQMNDWEIRKFLVFVLSIQLAMWGTIGLDAINLQIPIIRQIIGFIYLTFIPGIIILRILRLHNLGNIETLLYAVGLSLSTIMLTGFLMNMVYPFFGISKPISITPLMTTISAIVLILSILCYIIDKNFSNQNFIDVKEFLSPPALFLSLIPFLAVFGTYSINYYGNNFLSLLLLIIIAAIPILIGFDKFITKKYYPLAIIVIALSLLYHTSLISIFLVEWGDISFEYWSAKIALMDSIWDPTIASNVNGMISITMLAPIFSNIFALNLTWIFKIIYPILFSLVPLGLYQIIQKQTDSKVAFISVFFFMSMFTFFTTMLGLARQQIAELFFILSILLFIDQSMNRVKRSSLLILFGSSLVVSHYALSYLYIFSLNSTWLIIFIKIIPKLQKLVKKISQDKSIIVHNFIDAKSETLSTSFVMLSIIFALTWYLYVSNSSIFKSIIYIGNHIADSIFIDFLNPKATQGLDIILAPSGTGLIGYFNKVIHLTTQFFIAIGLSFSLLKGKDRNFHLAYLAFSIPFFGFAISGLIVPYFAGALNTTRLYGITLLILAPFCVIGGEIVSKTVCKVAEVPLNHKNTKQISKIISIFFAVYFLFNSGLIYEFAGYSTTASLNPSTSNITLFDPQEVKAALWLSNNIDSTKRIYADSLNAYLIQMELGSFNQLQAINEEKYQIPDNPYFFVGKRNINGKIWLSNPNNPRMRFKSTTYNNSTLFNTVLFMNEIYNNEGTIVFQ